MKHFLLSLALLLLPTVLFGQPPSPAPAEPPVAAQLAPGTLRSPEELEQLLAPIALYPDALIALILPAAAAATDVVLAARHLRANPDDRSQIEHRAWDESVKSLTHYPEVLLWMDENLAWTNQVGDAFALQPADVMQAVQRLRAKARAAGTLIDTPQQQVIAEPQVIRIVPAQPDVIYVPRYEPDIVFISQPVYYSRPFLTFGFGVPVGSWLAYECDWRTNTIWVGNRFRPWHRPDWRQPLLPIDPIRRSHSHARAPEVRPWRPSVNRPPAGVGRHFRPEIARPTAVAALHPRSFAPPPEPTPPRWNETDRNRPNGDRRWNSPGGATPRIAPLPQANPTSPPHDRPQSRVTRSAVLPPAALPRPAPPATVNLPSPSLPNVNPPRNREWSRSGDAGSRPQSRTAPTAIIAPLPMAGSVGGTDFPTVVPAPRSAPHAGAGSPTPPPPGASRRHGAVGSAPASASGAETSPPPARVAPSGNDGGARWNGRPHNSIGR